MYQQKFIGRKKELQFLEEKYLEEKPQLLIIYGRRRVGKTELVKQFMKNKPHLYFLADERGDIPNIKELQKIMAHALSNPLLAKAAITDWLELFTEFSKLLTKKIVIIIDEFPYLIKTNKAIPSIFQKIWDSLLAHKQVQLILLGSSISAMETQVLNYRSPLYGRRTGQWKVQPLPFHSLSDFFPYTAEELINCYAVLDGIPLYLLQFDPESTVMQNIEKKIFAKGNFLYEEAEILLRQEVREPANYFNILKAIASGKTTFGEIVGFTALDKTLISKYLDNLILLRIVEKEFPLTQKKETRNARYKLTDNYYSFWFRFVYPNRTILEEGKSAILVKSMANDFKQHVSFVFEKVCRETLIEEISPAYTKKGRWWEKAQEIDIVAFNEENKELLLGECKWQENVDAKKVLAELKEKAPLVYWHNTQRTESYALFAKSFKEKITEKNLYLFDLKDIQRILKRH